MNISLIDHVWNYYYPYNNHFIQIFIQLVTTEYILHVENSCFCIGMNQIKRPHINLAILKLMESNYLVAISILLWQGDKGQAVITSSSNPPIIKSHVKTGHTTASPFDKLQNKLYNLQSNAGTCLCSLTGHLWEPVSSDAQINM